jgi:hypothetical protein
VDRPPHYDSFAEFQYSYHYGDIFVPRIEQDEPLTVECQHFLDCVRGGEKPLSCGRKGRDLVKILEASTSSLRSGGGCIRLLSEDQAPKRQKHRTVSVDESPSILPVARKKLGKTQRILKVD